MIDERERGAGESRLLLLRLLLRIAALGIECGTLLREFGAGVWGNILASQFVINLCAGFRKRTVGLLQIGDLRASVSASNRGVC